MAGRAVTIGTFDGVHRGHRLVIDTLRAEAANRGLSPAVITFDRHPLELIAPERAPRRIMLPEDERKMLASVVEEVILIPFDAATRSMSVARWMAAMRERWDVRLIVMGYDNTFGSDGLMLDLGGYAAIGNSEGIEVTGSPVLKGISSSAIRKEITEGRVGTAASMLGRDHSLHGMVVHGKALGRTLGFPTANLIFDSRLLVPASGVYAAYATLPDGSKHKAVVNIGIRPTVADPAMPPSLSVEAHVTDWSGDLYGKEVTLTFVNRLRNEEHFPSIDHLRNAIAADIESVKALP